MKNLATALLCLCLASAHSVQAAQEFDTFDEPCWQSEAQTSDKVFRVDGQRLLLLWRGLPYLIRPKDQDVLLLNALGAYRGKTYVWPRGFYRGVSLADDVKLEAGAYKFAFAGSTVTIQQPRNHAEVVVDFAACLTAPSKKPSSHRGSHSR